MVPGETYRPCIQCELHSLTLGNAVSGSCTGPSTLPGVRLSVGSEESGQNEGPSLARGARASTSVENERGPLQVCAILRCHNASNDIVPMLAFNKKYILYLMLIAMSWCSSVWMGHKYNLPIFVTWSGWLTGCSLAMK